MIQEILSNIANKFEIVRRAQCPWWVRVFHRVHHTTNEVYESGFMLVRVSQWSQIHMFCGTHYFFMIIARAPAAPPGALFQ